MGRPDALAVGGIESRFHRQEEYGAITILQGGKTSHERLYREHFDIRRHQSHTQGFFKL
ncbi:MAG: hypothetical protein R3B74_05495 [Nitrospirales bacterium]|nr:hypothetical protein [Nitrospirales bacterium]